MKLFLPLTAFLASLLFCPGCMSWAATRDAVTEKSTQMRPERAWISSTGQIAISGYAYKSGKETKCYVILPTSLLNQLKNAGNQVSLSQIGKLNGKEMEKVKLIAGEVPSQFQPLTATETNGDVAYVDKRTVLHPGPMIALPFAIVFDALTFPIQLKLLSEWENVH